MKKVIFTFSVDGVKVRRKNAPPAQKHRKKKGKGSYSRKNNES